jgi:succinate dehydrogenase / fumarate reductase iron-sulfur subunit
MAEQQVQFKILRYKQGQGAPSYQNFGIAVNEDTTVLVALQDIRRDQDPTLVLRHSCHHASCGTCGMKINGRDELACVVKVLDLDNSTIVVEPLDNLPLISDLVVDMSGFYGRFTEPEMDYLRESEFIPEAQIPENLEKWLRFENCLECGICVSACPITGSDPEYLGPAVLAAAWRVVAEPRNGNPQKTLDWVDNEHGCWRCHVAFECTEACPSDVDPAGAIMALRGELTKGKFRRLFGRG